MRGSWKALVLASLAFVLVALLAGCGNGGALPATGGVASASAPAQFKVATIEDHQLRFKVSYPYGWLVSRWRAPAGPRKTGEQLLNMAFANPKGTVVDGKYIDGEQLSVFRLNREVKAGANYPSTARNIVMGNLLPKLHSVQIIKPLQQISVHGDPGWRIGYRYHLGSHTVFAESALILKHTYAYWLTGQSDAYAWRTSWPVLSVVLGAFQAT